TARQRDQLMGLLQRSFRPEFLNRIDETIIFQSLDSAQLRRITELLLEESKRRLHAQNVELDIDDAAVDWLARQGYQPEFGARPLRRTIQRKLDNTLSRLLLEGTLRAGQRVHVGVLDDDLAFTVQTGDEPPDAETPPHARAHPEPSSGEDRRAERAGQYL